MKRVVSVSLGTSKRDKTHRCTILGVEFQIERRGTDGSKSRFKQLMEELDGQVDALGVGGADIWAVSGDRKFAFRDVLRLVSGVKKTPVVDGGGLKHTLEREAVARLQADGTVDFRQEHVLLVSAADRFGLAQALDAACPHVVYGDFLFALGLPIPLRTYRQVRVLANLVLPIVTLFPIEMFYPTGEKQERRTPKFARFFDEATFVCGDWHFIRRFMPDRMDGKTVMTQTVRQADLELLTSAGVRRVITTTPVMDGESFATNVMEGVVLTLLGKRPGEATPEDYRGMLARLGWKPNVIELRRPGQSDAAVNQEDQIRI